MTDFLVEMHLVDELVGRLIIDDKFVLGNKILRLAVQHTADNVGLPNEGSKAKCLVSSKKGKKNKNEMNNLLPLIGQQGSSYSMTWCATKNTTIDTPF